MFSLTTVIVTVIITLTTGVVIGALLSRFISPQTQKARSLESQLKQTESHLSDYQQQVTEHFAETAKLVNSLTQSYRDVHEHLASDALKLANVDISRQLLPKTQSDEKLLGETSIQEENFQPPRDWAPKSPGQEGTLSEGFGLAEDYAEAEAAAPKTS